MNRFMAAIMERFAGIQAPACPFSSDWGDNSSYNTVRRERPSPILFLFCRLVWLAWLRCEEGSYIVFVFLVKEWETRILLVVAYGGLCMDGQTLNGPE
ncbi:hypothetical protein [Entomobacter blattae]|uniref:hypothetical protein n=1 Tax=Entomobacter blattae TaxID=2762277 RepID=UPI00193C500A|nr:hypothetical protein [Entomobacter blattae]